MTAMTAAGFPRHPMLGRRRTTYSQPPIVDRWDRVQILRMVLRPVVVTAAVFVASMGSTTPAHADSIGDAIDPVLGSAGIGNNGPISSTIAGLGQSICPMLVRPGSSLAGDAAQISGNGGLAPPIAGFLAGMAIQAECPAFMTSIANGHMPFPIAGATPLGPPAAPAPFALQLPGITPPGSNSLPLPGR